MLNNLSPIYHPANHLSTGTENSTRENLMSKMFYNGKWIFNSVISPTDYAAAAKGWCNRGVQVIGGCCGVGPTHIRALTAKK